MATFKEYIFLNDKKKDGTYAVAIRITHNRKSRYIPSGIFVTDSQLTRTGKIKDRFVQDIIDKKLKEYRELAYDININATELDVDEFMVLLKKKTEQIDFFRFAEKEMEKYRRDKDRQGTYRVYRNSLNSLKKFVGRETLPFDDMKKGLIQDYYDDLLTRISERTANDYLTRLKTLHNVAIKKLNDEEAGIIVVKYHCFDGLQKEKIEKNQSKAFKTVEEMQAVIDCPYVKRMRANFAKDMFILSFLLNGMNMEDIFNLRHVQHKDGQIIHNRHKIVRRCGKNAESVIKTLDVVELIIKKYAGDPKYLIKFSRLPYQHSYTNLFIHEIFQAAGVEEQTEIRGGRRVSDEKSEYTFNTARHSMASFCRNICNVPKDIVDYMLVHTPEDVDVYYQKPYELMWEANEKLYALFNWDNYKEQLKLSTI